MQIIIVAASLFIYLASVLAVMMFGAPSWAQFLVLIVMPSIAYVVITYWFIQIKRRKKKEKPVKKALKDPDITLDIAYKLLGVPKKASIEHIHDAHVKLMKLVHPDSGGPEHLAKLINEAKSVIMEHKKPREIPEEEK